MIQWINGKMISKCPNKQIPATSVPAINKMQTNAPIGNQTFQRLYHHSPPQKSGRP